MQQLPYQSSIRLPPVISRILGVAAAALVLTTAVFVGTFVLAALLGFAAIAGLIIYFRIRRLNRQLRSNAKRSSMVRHQIIEGRFRRE